MSYVDTVWNQAYTGNQRCRRCTVANVALASAASVFTGLIRPPLGVAILGVSLVVIYVRGYLVPGTPTLTRRFFPDSVLRWFGKDPMTQPDVRVSEETSEQLLKDADVLVSAAREQNVQLAPSFRDAWRERIQSIRDSTLKGVFAEVLDVQRNRITIDNEGESFAVYAEDIVVGPWDSRPAAVVDVAAWSELDSWSDQFDRLSVEETTRLLTWLRSFVQRCPACDAPVTIDRTEIESCCASFDLVTLRCTECGSLLLKRQADDDIGDHRFE